MLDLTSLAAEIHSQNVDVGWWDEWPVKTDRHETAMMLVVSELAEAMEGDRKDLMDDHLPEFKAFGVELADAMIRLLDLAGAYELELDRVDELVGRGKQLWNTNSVPEQLFKCVTSVSAIYRDYKNSVQQGIVSVIIIAELNGVDLWKLVELKRAYNQKRADHKRENRAAVGGKAY